jgi:hypothetical protein
MRFFSDRARAYEAASVVLPEPGAAPIQITGALDPSRS